MMRTHNCGELRKKDIKKKVTICGWNHSRRDHGGVIFVDLRDRYGLTQVVFDPKINKSAHKIAERLSREDVLQVTGGVRQYHTLFSLILLIDQYHQREKF